MDFIRFLFSRLFLKHLLIALAIFVFLFSFTFLFLKLFTHHNRGLPLPDLYGMTPEQVEEVVTKKKLRFEIIDSVYQQEAKKGTVIDQIPSAGFKVKKGRRILLIMNATQPEKVAMPSVVGVSLRQAKAILETNGLQVGKLSYVPDIAINNVLRQRYANKDIENGTQILKGSSIDLVLGNGYSSQYVTPPKLKGLNYRSAKAVLLQSFLNTGAVIYDNTVNNYIDSASAIIWKQRPESGSIPQGSSVDIWLTKDSIKTAQFLTKDTIF
jgi:eukaryotic-like serine/threonine-protein kinase